MKQKWVVVDLSDNTDADPLSVYANSAIEAAQMATDAGPADFADEPKYWPHGEFIKLEAIDLDGRTYPVRVYGPFPPY